MFDAKTLLPPRNFPTPFGEVETPTIELPPVRLPSLGAGERSLVKHAMGADLTSLLQKIPGVGAVMGPIGDALYSMHRQQIHNQLLPGEYSEFVKWDNTYPTTIAVLRTLL